MSKLDRHAETRVSLSSPAEAVFSLLDDHSRLSAHMTKRNWMMAGSRMVVETDAAAGRAVGSKIRLYGQVLGIGLTLDEAVIERNPPLRKVWETTSEPRLLVIGEYRMGFEITPSDSGCTLLVFLDYALPRSGLSRWLGVVLSGAYARWCTRRMARDARHAGSE